MSERKKPHYSLEFKRDAAQLILSKGYTYPEVTTSLGVSASALRKGVNAEKGQTLKKDKLLRKKAKILTLLLAFPQMLCLTCNSSRVQCLYTPATHKFGNYQ